MSNELKHFGVLGMRWGSRRGQLYRKNTMLTKSRQNALDKSDLKRLEKKKGFRSAHQKNLDAKKAEILRNRIENAKTKKVKDIPKKSIYEGKTTGEKVLLTMGMLSAASVVINVANYAFLAAFNSH